MNIVALNGFIATDIEHSVVNGHSLSKFRIAVRQRGKKDASFFNVVVWGKQAEAVNQYLSKGRRIGIHGRLEQNTWEVEGGGKRERVEVVANEVEFLDKAPERDEAEVAPRPEAMPSASSSTWNPSKETADLGF